MFGGEFGSKCFDLFLLCFLLGMARKRRGHKDSVGNQEGDCFKRLKSWFLFLSFLLVTICTLFRHCLVQWPFCMFFLLLSSNLDQEFSFSFAFFGSLMGNFFFFFPLIFDRGFFLSSNLWSGIFYFCFFLLEAYSQLNSKWSLFLGRPFCSFF